MIDSVKNILALMAFPSKGPPEAPHNENNPAETGESFQVGPFKDKDYLLQVTSKTKRMRLQ